MTSEPARPMWASAAEDLRGALWASPNGSRKPRKADQAYRRLKHLILTLQLEPGQPLDERELMATLDTGRTPLREAMQRLAHERLIRIAPRRGSWVRELSLTELQEMIAARHLVEPPVAGMAAERATPERIDVLREIIAKADDAFAEEDMLSAVYHDLEFHREVAIMSGNTYLARIVTQINTAMLRYWYVSFDLVGDTAPVFMRHHTTIVDQLEHGDPAATSHEMTRHIEVFSERMRRAIWPGQRSWNNGHGEVAGE